MWAGAFRDYGNDTLSVARPNSTSGRLRCHGMKRSIVRTISDEKWTGWKVMVRPEMAWRFRASQGGGVSTRLGSGSWSRVFRAAAAASHGKGAVSRLATDPCSAASVLCCRSTTGGERGSEFYVYPFSSPFSVSHMFCVHHGLYRTGYHGFLVLYCLVVVWFWVCIERNGAERQASEQNMAREDEKRGKRELSMTIPYPTPYRIPPLCRIQRKE
ncbi:uncharacterized protein B0H64DRAFT_80220 [Chaetomium fimeti]|uniref:Uncharacterized protein n=1 Tax=Chaetomium fimeti TaxID=1854472 RepID=A0AAE0LV49_9PEZI|nr:hypothetical protein B0H64DRAFT_80220 [Chaetomium fimeti]